MHRIFVLINHKKVTGANMLFFHTAFTENNADLAGTQCQVAVMQLTEITLFCSSGGSGALWTEGAKRTAGCRNQRRKGGL